MQFFGLHKNYDMNIGIFHFIVRKMRHREVKELAMGHTAWKWQGLALKAEIQFRSSLAY